MVLTLLVLLSDVGELELEPFINLLSENERYFKLMEIHRSFIIFERVILYQVKNDSEFQYY